MDPVRRGLFTGRALTQEGRETTLRAITPLGPLPPWHMAIISRCSDCSGPCVEVCETRILKRHEEGHQHEGEPWLDFSSSGCTFCGDCAQACPELGASGELEKRQPAMRAEINTESCLAYRGVMCISCQPQCNVRAIGRDRLSRAVINADLCTGCGFCVHVCPADAISIS